MYLTVWKTSSQQLKWWFHPWPMSLRGLWSGPLVPWVLVEKPPFWQVSSLSPRHSTLSWHYLPRCQAQDCKNGKSLGPEGSSSAGEWGLITWGTRWLHAKPHSPPHLEHPGTLGLHFHPEQRLEPRLRTQTRWVGKEEKLPELDDGEQGCGSCSTILTGVCSHTTI